MSAKRRPMRYAHAEGHTDVCYSSRGDNIITCGSDGDVRFWTDLTDDDPTSQCVGEHAISLAIQEDRLYVGTDNNSVQAYTFPGAERDGIISRFTAPVTHISALNGGKLIASGSCDMEIHVKNKETSESLVLSGHKAPILCVALDPKEEFLATSSCDGTVRVWNLQKNGEVIKSWDCVPTCNNFYKAKCLARVSWQPKSGVLLAVPDGLCINFYKRETWDKVFTLTDDAVTHPFSISAFSPCGFYLAASTSNGDICIWDVKSKSLSNRTSHDRNYSICGLVWNPRGNGEIAFCDIMGQLGTVEECIPSSSEQEPENKVQAKDSTALNDSIQFNSFIEDDDDDDENVISLEKIKAGILAPINSDLDEDKPNSVIGDEDLESRPPSRLVSPIVDLQPPFQPSSTPVHLQHRYLVWNSVGIVRCQNTESENSIDVEFTDSAVHHAIHVNNYLKHSMAALTDQVLVLAAEAFEDAPSKVVCVLLNSWDGQKEWTMNLPGDEEVLAVAAGHGWLTVATDTRNLRFFTISGSQREVISLPGPVVTVAAQGSRLMVVHHNGLGLPGDQNLGFAVFNVSRNEISMVTPWQALPLSPKSTLQWVGHSDEGSPITVDSTGMMRFLCGKGYWLPICQTDEQCKGKSDHYFIIGVSECYENIRCILCKGARYPPTTPKPLVTELPFKLPLCEDTTEKTQLEEKFWLSQLIAPSLNDHSSNDIKYLSDKEANEAVMKQTIIKLFALSCRSGCQQQALDLGGLMPSEKVVELAIKYASKLNKNHLADKLRDSFASRDICDGADRYMHNINNTPIRAYGSLGLQPDEYESNLYGSEVATPDPIAKSETESLILSAKIQEELSEQIKPTLVLSGSRKNPFKKSLNNQNLDTSGLDLLSSHSPHINNKSNKQVQQQTPSELPQKTAKSKQTTLAVTGVQASKKKSQVSFVQWYSINKPSLQDEFPELSAGDLTKLAMKRFKEEKERKADDPASAELEDSPQIKKRKLDKVNVHSEENNEAQSIQDDEEGSRNASVGSTFNPSMKSDSKNKEIVKKVSSTSKLMAFAFKKSS